MHLIPIQKQAIWQLLQHYRRGEKLVNFKAPTGSGKTFMISNFVSEIFADNPSNQKIFVLLATLSSSDLPRQFRDKVEQYMNYLPYLYSVDYRQSPSVAIQPKDYEPTLSPQENTMIIVGKSSFTKSSIFVKNGIFDQFLHEIKNANYRFIYIRDEAHHGGLLTKKMFSDSEGKKFEKKIYDNADFILRMTATMPTESSNLVVIEENQVNDEPHYLLKATLKQNLNLQTTPDEMDNLEFLELAIQQFRKVQSEYKQLIAENIHVRPAMLIQVDSKTEKNKEHFDNDIQKITETLEKYNLSWVKYFAHDKNDTNLKYAPSLLEMSQKDSPVDVIIFKIGPATGWDIPRACMLVQLRHVDSSILNQQALGRIRRNPLSDLTYREVTDKYYLYSNYQASTRKLRTYVLKEKFRKSSWLKGVVDINKHQQNLIENNYVQKVAKFLKKKRKSLVEEIRHLFDKDWVVTKTFSLKNDEGVFKTLTNFKINNALALRKFIIEQRRIHDWLFQPIISLVKDFCQQNQINTVDTLWYVLLQPGMSKELNNLFQANNNPISFYKIQDAGPLPLHYDIWEDTKGENTVLFQPIDDIYAYRNADQKAISQQSLDSRPESFFMNHIVSEFNQAKINGKDWVQEVTLLTKNPNRVSNIYLQYYENNTKKKKLFLDFVFKIGKANCYFYIEVKSGDNDIDPAKTKMIENILSNYAEVEAKSQIIVFAIVKVSNKGYFRLDCCNYSNIKTIVKEWWPTRVIEELVKMQKNQN